VTWINSLAGIISENRRVRFAKMKLSGTTQLYWESIEESLIRRGQPPITDLVGTATITNTRVIMTLMTLMIVSVPMTTVKDQFILVMMTLTSES